MRAWFLSKTSHTRQCMTGLWPFKIGKIAIIDLVNKLKSSFIIQCLPNLYSSQIYMRDRFLSKTSQIRSCMTELWPFKIDKIAIIDLVNTIKTSFIIQCLPNLYSSQIYTRAQFLSKTSQIHPCMMGLWPFKIAIIVLVNKIVIIYYPIFTKLIQQLDIHESLLPFENQPDPSMPA